MPEPDAKPWERFWEFLTESTRIFQGFKMAVDAKKLVFAFAGVLLWALGAMLITVLANVVWLLIIIAAVVLLGIMFLVAARAETEMAPSKMAVFLGAGAAVIVGLAIAAWILASDWNGLFGLFQLIWGLVVMSFFGTAIARIAALNATTDDTVGPRSAVRFALKKFTTTIWALIMPVLATLAFGAVVAVISILGRVPAVGAVWYIILGVLYVIPVLIALLFAAILLVYTPSLLLFQPVIAVEGNDSFEAVSTSYSFVATKPWRLAFYALAAATYGWIVIRVAAMVFVGAGILVNWFMAHGMGPRMLEKIDALDLSAILGSPWQFWWFPAYNGIEHFTGGHVLASFKAADTLGGHFIVAWQHVLLVAFLAFVVSLFYSLITQIFLLMRKACYATPFDEVYIETTEEEKFAAEFAGTPIPARVTPPAAKEAPKADTPAPKPEINPADKPIDLVGNEPPHDTGQ
jgi:hypothetical protein